MAVKYVKLSELPGLRTHVSEKHYGKEKHLFGHLGCRIDGLRSGPVGLFYIPLLLRLSLVD